MQKAYLDLEKDGLPVRGGTSVVGMVSSRD